MPNPRAKIKFGLDLTIKNIAFKADPNGQLPNPRAKIKYGLDLMVGKWFHVRCKKDLTQAHGWTRSILSMWRQWARLKKCIHDIFRFLINTIEAHWLGTNIVSNKKMRFFHLSIPLNHIGHHFGTKGSLQCNIYKLLIFNEI